MKGERAVRVRAMEGERAMRVALSVAGAALFLGVWWIASRAPHASALLLPGPDAVVRAFVAFVHEPFANVAETCGFGG